MCGLNLVFDRKKSNHGLLWKKKKSSENISIWILSTDQRYLSSNAHTHKRSRSTTTHLHTFYSMMLFLLFGYNRWSFSHVKQLRTSRTEALWQWFGEKRSSINSHPNDVCSIIDCHSVSTHTHTIYPNQRLLRVMRLENQF